MKVNVTEDFINNKKKEKPYVIKNFEREISLIKNSELNSFYHNVLLLSPIEFQNDKELQAQIKKAFAIVYHNLTASGVQGDALDAVIGMTLISKILKHEIKGEYSNLYPLALDQYLKKNKLDKFLPPGLYKNLLKEVATHLGHESPIEDLMPRPGSLAMEIYTAFKIAEMPGLTIDLDSYYETLK